MLMLVIDLFFEGVRGWRFFFFFFCKQRTWICSSSPVGGASVHLKVLLFVLIVLYHCQNITMRTPLVFT